MPFDQEWLEKHKGVVDELVGNDLPDYEGVAGYEDRFLEQKKAFEAISDNRPDYDKNLALLKFIAICKENGSVGDSAAFLGAKDYAVEKFQEGQVKESDDLTQKVHELQSKNEVLKAAQDGLESDLDELRSELDAARAELEAGLKAAKEEADKEKEAELKQQAEYLKMEFEKLAGELRRQGAEEKEGELKGKFEKELNEKEGEIAEAKSDAAVERVKNAELKKGFKKAEDRIRAEVDAEYLELSEKLAAENEQLREAVTPLVEENERLRDTLQELREAALATTEAVEITVEEVRSPTTDEHLAEELRARIKKLQEMVFELSVNKSSLEDENEKLAGDFQDFKGKASEELSTMNLRLLSRQARLQAALAALDEKAMEAEKSKEERDVMAVKLQELQTSLDEARREVVAERAWREDEAAKAREAEERATLNSAEAQMEAAKVVGLEQEIDDAREERDAANLEAHLAGRRVESLERDVVAEKARADHEKSKADRSKDEVAKLREENAALRERLAGLSEEAEVQEVVEKFVSGLVGKVISGAMDVERARGAARNSQEALDLARQAELAAAENDSIADSIADSGVESVVELEEGESVAEGGDVANMDDLNDALAAEWDRREAELIALRAQLEKLTAKQSESAQQREDEEYVVVDDGVIVSDEEERLSEEVAKLNAIIEELENEALSGQVAGKRRPNPAIVIDDEHVDSKERNTDFVTEIEGEDEIGGDSLEERLRQAEHESEDQRQAELIALRAQLEKLTAKQSESAQQREDEEYVVVDDGVIVSDEEERLSEEVAKLNARIAELENEILSGQVASKRSPNPTIVIDDEHVDSKERNTDFVTKVEPTRPVLDEEGEVVEGGDKENWVNWGEVEGVSGVSIDELQAELIALREQLRDLQKDSEMDITGAEVEAAEVDIADKNAKITELNARIEELENEVLSGQVAGKRRPNPTIVIDDEHVDSKERNTDFVTKVEPTRPVLDEEAEVNLVKKVEESMTPVGGAPSRSDRGSRPESYLDKFRRSAGSLPLPRRGVARSTKGSLLPADGNRVDDDSATFIVPNTTPAPTHGSVAQVIDVADKERIAKLEAELAEAREALLGSELKAQIAIAENNAEENEAMIAALRGGDSADESLRANASVQVGDDEASRLEQERRDHEIAQRLAEDEAARSGTLAVYNPGRGDDSGSYTITLHPDVVKLLAGSKLLQENEDLRGQNEALRKLIAAGLERPDAPSSPLVLSDVTPEEVGVIRELLVVLLEGDDRGASDIAEVVDNPNLVAEITRLREQLEKAQRVATTTDAGTSPVADGRSFDARDADRPTQGDVFKLSRENAELRVRLAEAEERLNAFGFGDLGDDEEIDSQQVVDLFEKGVRSRDGEVDAANTKNARLAADYFALQDEVTALRARLEKLEKGGGVAVEVQTEAGGGVDAETPVVEPASTPTSASADTVEPVVERRDAATAMKSVASVGVDAAEPRGVDASVGAGGEEDAAARIIQRAWRDKHREPAVKSDHKPTPARATPVSVATEPRRVDVAEPVVERRDDAVEHRDAVVESATAEPHGVDASVGGDGDVDAEIRRGDAGLVDVTADDKKVEVDTDIAEAIKRAAAALFKGDREKGWTGGDAANVGEERTVINSILKYITNIDINGEKVSFDAKEISGNKNAMIKFAEALGCDEIGDDATRAESSINEKLKSINLEDQLRVLAEAPRYNKKPSSRVRPASALEVGAAGMDMSRE